MPGTRWDTFRDLMALQEKMNRLFEQTLSRSRTPAEIAASGTWSPAVDLYETPNEFVLKVELPEVEQKDIELRITSNRLTLKGERLMQEQVRQDHFHRMERAFGHFSRAFSLPGSVDPDRVQAELKDGILRVIMPKMVDGRSKPIRISTT
jgi:HSP20 family protein